MSMAVYVIIRRKKKTLYLEVTGDTKIFTFKKMIGEVFKVQPADQQLFLMFVNDSYLDEYHELSESNVLLKNCGLTSSAATITHPAIVGLAVRQKDGSFEKLEITPYSDLQWPKLPPNLPTDEDMEKLALHREKYARLWQKLHGEANPGQSINE